MEFATLARLLKDGASSEELHEAKRVVLSGGGPDLVEALILECEAGEGVESAVDRVTDLLEALMDKEADIASILMLHLTEPADDLMMHHVYNAVELYLYDHFPFCLALYIHLRMPQMDDGVKQHWRRLLSASPWGDL